MTLWDVEGLGAYIGDGEVAVQSSVVGQAGEASGNDLDIRVIGIFEGFRQLGAVCSGIVENELSGFGFGVAEAVRHEGEHVVGPTTHPLKVVVEPEDQCAVGLEGEAFGLVEQRVDALLRQVEQGGLVHFGDDPVHQG